MKRWIALLCVMALLLSMLAFVGCQNNEGDTPDGETPGGETPGGETPGGDNPGGGNPGGDNPGGDTTPTVPDESQGGNDPYVPDIEW